MPSRPVRPQPSKWRAAAEPRPPSTAAATAAADQSPDGTPDWFTGADPAAPASQAEPAPQVDPAPEEQPARPADPAPRKQPAHPQPSAASGEPEQSQPPAVRSPAGANGHNGTAHGLAPQRLDIVLRRTANDAADVQRLDKLGTLLKQHPGLDRVRLTIAMKAAQVALALPHEVDANQQIVDEVSSLLGSHGQAQIHPDIEANAAAPASAPEPVAAG